MHPHLTTETLVLSRRKHRQSYHSRRRQFLTCFGAEVQWEDECDRLMWPRNTDRGADECGRLM